MITFYFTVDAPVSDYDAFYGPHGFLTSSVAHTERKFRELVDERWLDTIAIWVTKKFY